MDRSRPSDSIPLTQVQSHHSNGYGRQDSISPQQQKGEKASSKVDRHHLGHGHRAKPGTRGRQHAEDDGEGTTLNRMGRIYLAVLNFSIITRYFLYVLPIALIIAVPIVVGATAAQNARIGGVKMVWFFTWIEVVWLSLWVSKIFAHFLPLAFTILAGVVSSGVRKYALIIRAVEIPISLVGWAVTSLVTFRVLMTKTPGSASGVAHWESIVISLLCACVASTVLLLVEKFLIQLMSINYHRKQFNERIRDSKRNVYILGLLYDASRNLFPMYCAEFAEEDYIIADQLNLHKAFQGSGGGKSNRHSGSATPMRLLQNVGRVGDKVTSAFGNVAHEITGKEVFNPNSAHSIVVEALEKKSSSEALARRLWMSFVIEGNESLYQEDIVDVIGHEHRAEAEEAFSALDRDGNGDISLDEMIMTVTEFGRDRKAIANSMHDVDQAITVLDRLLLTVVAIATVFIFVAFLVTNFTTMLATAGTALLSLSFVFAATTQEVLGSCIFLFVKHPYDIGDRVDIAKDQLTVDHISLLFTVFRRVSGENVGRLVQIPNIVLNTLYIENISRSKAMKEQISIMVSYDTTFQDIQLLKTQLLNFVRDKENARDFQPDLEVEVLGTSDLSKMELRVEIQHKSNWSNETLRAARRSKFMCALIAALRRVPIYGPGGGGDPLGSAANASYSVSIPPDDAASRKDAAAKAKDAARLVPKDQQDTDEDGAGIRHRSSSRIPGNNTLGLTKTQSHAMNALNSRDPLKDTVRDDALATSSSDDKTFVERPSMDVRDEAAIQGIVRRESSKGRRKAGGTEYMHPAVGGWPSSNTNSAPPPQASADFATRTSEDSKRYNPAAVRPPLGTINSMRSMTDSTGNGNGGPAPAYSALPTRSPSDSYRQAPEGAAPPPPRKNVPRPGPYEEV